MFRFENPIFLYFLVIIPVLVAVRFFFDRRRLKRVKRFGDPELVGQMMEDVSKYRPKVKFWLLTAALTLIIIMLARPQMGTRISRDKRQGIEAIICMDISNSMLATDVVPSRLAKSKLLVENMVDKFVNDKVGLIVYAGDAFVQLPITSDYVSAKMFMHSINPSLIASQGTDIAAAINLAMLSFTPDEKAGKAIIVITDGEDHEGKALEMAKAAKEKGIRVFILGVGTTKGSTIRMADGHYLTDNTGETVITRLNENMCKEIASAGSGTYIHVDNTGEAQRRLDDEITKMQKGEVETIIYSEYDEQFQAVGIIVLLLLLIETVILERKNPLLRNVKLFKRRNTPKMTQANEA
ncbi:MAG: VWA domain-containing protein [Prevotella sp.]|nr:VWA domain-containing protein [Prevotella sp.]